MTDDIFPVPSEDDIITVSLHGARNTLDHIRNHMDTYKGFGGSGGYYHIPKDTHAQIARVLNGKETELSERVQRTIREKVALIEQETGRPFMEAVRPSVSEYGEIQRGTVSKTLDRSEDTLRERNAEKKANIADSHRPSLSDAAKAVGLAAAVTGVFSLTTSFYAKCKSGKNPFKGDFTADDWRDVGVSTAKGTAGGTVSAGAIYVMTNYSRMSAPLASAFVSAGKGVYALQRSYSRGEIDAREFVELGTVACSEAAIVAVVTALGQIAIPIPLLGPTIGSMAGRLVAEFATGKTKEEAERMRKDMENFLARLDGNMQKVFSSIELEFDRIGSLTAAAFDIERNCSLVLASIELARAYGVEESRILKTNDDLERFLFS
ncbi:MAG: hypothetical protein EOM12_14550 [Verrucomicrobiae bacterium]|nr:hypothetical protein [Verrucomicrobiae bacterium]